MPRPLSATRTTLARQEGDLDVVRKAAHRLVAGVVENFPDQVVQAVGTRGADVHARTLADGSSPSRTEMSSALYDPAFRSAIIRT